MQITVDPALDAPPSRQLVEAILDGVATGELRAGDRIPSVRDAAIRAMVNPNTVAKAWRELEVRGVVMSRNGSGSFVTTEGPRLARKARQSATLDALARAISAALAAGHDPSDLKSLLSRLSAERNQEKR